MDEPSIGDDPRGVRGVGRVYAFVVRLWFEQGDREKAGEWRGEARDVESGRVQRFRFLDGMTGAVRRLLRLDEAGRDDAS